MGSDSVVLPDNDRNLFGWHPCAAARYSGDRECQYEDCDDEAEFFVEFEASGYTGGRGCLCCGPCGEENRLYPEANDLTDVPLSNKMVEALPSDVLDGIEEVSS